MTLQTIVDAVKRLPLAEQVELWGALGNMIGPPPREVPLTPGQAKDLDNRIDEYRAGKAEMIPGEQAIPALIATAIVQVALPDVETLGKAFADPGLHEVIDRWQSRHPYKVAWANHEPLA